MGDNIYVLSLHLLFALELEFLLCASVVPHLEKSSTLYVLQALMGFLLSARFAISGKQRLNGS